MPTFKHACGYEKTFEVKCPQCNSAITDTNLEHFVYQVMADHINHETRLEDLEKNKQDKII